MYKLFFINNLDVDGGVRSPGRTLLRQHFPLTGKFTGNFSPLAANVRRKPSLYAGFNEKGRFRNRELTGTYQGNNREGIGPDQGRPVASSQREFWWSTIPTSTVYGLKAASTHDE
jgi:hypothetical protein